MEPKVSAFKVPERHRKWVDIAEELSRDAFGPRAAMRSTGRTGSRSRTTTTYAPAACLR